MKKCTWHAIGVPLAMVFLVATAASGIGTLDRNYTLGDDSDEGASTGNPVGSGNAFNATYDSAGTPNFGDLHDLIVFGNPMYVSVSDRPGASINDIGASFDGDGDYLRGSNLNLPETSAASVNHDDDPSGVSTPGPLNYVGIVDRYFQLWVNPDSASTSATQSIVMDTNQHGLRIVDGNWSMRYANRDFDGSAVAFDDWTHVMVARPFGPDGGSRLYVDGVAVAAAPGGYDGSATEELVVGSNTGRDADLNFTGGTEEFFHGALDDLTLVVLGDNTSLGGMDWGSFEFALDNDFAAVEMAGVNVADVNMDGVVSGNGTGPAATDDVRAFVDGWLSRKEINGVLVGDLTTRVNGDLNFDGVTDLGDFSVLNAANPAMGSAIQNYLVPEPSSYVLSILSMGIILLGSRRRG